MDAYFSKFEDRHPPSPLPYSATRECIWQFFATLALILGAWYIYWRWTGSLNAEAMWFALPLVLAETMAYLGLILFVFNLWKDQPVDIPDAPEVLSEVMANAPGEDRMISVDVMFTTYDEDPDLVRLGVLDAKKMTYPHPIDIRIHVLDDGRREEMRAMCDAQGINYISRNTNEGFKAGNLRNAMEQTTGDFIVICDADTRPFPTFLRNTLGYFKDPQMAWVQTPQWFYDLPEGERLSDFARRKAGRFGEGIGSAFERVFGQVRLGQDPFVNDPKMFYDILLRRRNWANASFCCGAGSIHRREAVMEAALRSFADIVKKRIEATEDELTITTKEREIAAELLQAIRTEAVTEAALTPYKFHVSEDIFTSLVLHSDRARGWKSYLHPQVESKMLSPQDLMTWTIQRFKYAGGSLDILIHHNPLFRKGLTFAQRMMYASTFYSYLGPIWNFIFLIAPIVYLFSGVAPVDAYSTTFFIHLIPFLVVLEIATLLGTWGISGFAPKSSYLSFFPVGLRAIGAVARGKKISFPVTPKDRQSGNFVRLVMPQILVVGLTFASILWATAALTLMETSHSVTGVVANALWGLNNCIAMAGIIFAAFWKPASEL